MELKNVVFMPSHNSKMLGLVLTEEHFKEKTAAFVED